MPYHPWLRARQMSGAPFFRGRPWNKGFLITGGLFVS
jgi:hypothetical protein